MVRVPRACMMNPDTARASPFCGELIDRADLQQWQAMCLHLLTERAAGPQSRWWPYLEHLPDMSGHPLLWDDAAVSALEGSPMHARLVARIDNVIDDLEELVAVGANELPVGRGAGTRPIPRERDVLLGICVEPARLPAGPRAPRPWTRPRPPWSP